jgi:hypothetical protein
MTGKDGSISSRKITAAILLLLLAVLAWRTVFDFDFGTHMATGRWVVTNGTVPQTDPFTYTVSDREWLAYAWLFDVGVYQLERAVGVHGLTLARWLLILTTGLLLMDLLRLRQCSAVSASVVGLAAILMSETRFAIRPELVSDVLTAFSLWILERRRQGRTAPVWMLPLAHLIWVNTHLFVFGWAVLGVYTLDEVIRRRSLRTPLVAVAAASFAALFLNPYHYRAVVEPFLLAQRLGGGSIYAQSIRELTSPLNFVGDERVSLYVNSMWALLGAGAVSLAVHVSRRRWVDAALLAIFGALALVSMRNVVLYAVATLPAICTGLDDLGGILRRRLPWHRLGLLLWRGAGGLVVTAALTMAAITTVRVVTGSFYGQAGRPTRFASAIDRASFGLDAVEWLADHDLQGRGFNSFNLGGTLLWRDPAHKVFIDTRGDVGGEQLMQRYAAVSHPDVWDRAVRRYGFEYAVLGHRDLRLLLVRKLWGDPGWRVVYLDGTAIVFVRTDGPNGHLTQVALPPIAEEGTRANTLDQIRVEPGSWGRLRRWIGPAESPPSEDALRGGFWLRMNYPARAEPYLLRAALADPNAVVVQRNLSVVYYHAGLWEEALVTLRNLEALAPDDSAVSFLEEVSRKASEKSGGAS